MLDFQAVPQSCNNRCDRFKKLGGFHSSRNIALDITLNTLQFGASPFTNAKHGSYRRKTNVNCRRLKCSAAGVVC